MIIYNRPSSKTNFDKRGVPQLPPMRSICRPCLWGYRNFYLFTFSLFLWLTIINLLPKDSNFAHPRISMENFTIHVSSQKNQNNQNQNLEKIQNIQPTNHQSDIENLNDYSNFHFDNFIKIWNTNGKLPNPKFIFHNKMPKCGSSTMNNILMELAKLNQNFYFQKLDPHAIENDSLTSTKPLANYLKSNPNFINKNESYPFVILKHHFPIDDFKSKYDIDQPTYINVIRNPIDWFQSHYYFERFGWERLKASDGNGRNSFQGNEKERDMTIDECVLKKHDTCKSVHWNYIDFLCGNSDPCNTKGSEKLAVEHAKHKLLTFYYVVGILEQWDDTLNLFEKMMPNVYKDVQKVWHSKKVQDRRASTKTVNAVKMSNFSREYFQNGPLKYEWDLYSFARVLFNQRLSRLGL